ncbi:uncharacterized protein LOC108683470 [Hyalella azteca]|uniref:Uncharacterized protein LOC108683470 n=1 Tax=Hyalella azteca TaxID=294128 RepID=A0A8B7PPY4_HYAAZ|nr:uncharacterized protein LOC108683470 [Hyalella azteca]
MRRTLLWYENGQVLDDVSVEELLGGYKLSSLHINNLSPTDHLRRFTCSVGSPDDPSVSSSVVLHVIDELKAPLIEEVQDTATCDAQDLEEHLQLCWYRGTERLLCQDNQTELIRRPQTRTASLPLEITDEFCEVELTCRIQLKKNENVLNESVASELEETFSRAESSLFAACRQKPFKVPRALAGAIDEVLSKPIVESLNIITEDVLDAQAAELDESSSLISTCCEETQVLEEETQVLTKSSDDDAAVTPLDTTSKISL